MIEAPGITVNGFKITPDQISAEVQYHPAANLPEAKYQAMQALVIRELLVQRAASLGLCDHDSTIGNPDEAIETLLEREIIVPEPSHTECERYYNSNRDRFHTAPIFEASHIFYPAPADDQGVRDSAYERAITALNKIKQNPELFESIAHAESACSSAKMSGFLGQISKGQTVPAFEAALLTMNEGDISAEPVATQVGYHIIRMHKRAEGKPLPLETALTWIADYLKKECWQNAFRQYIQILAGQATISGFKLKSAETPLVQ